MMHGPINIRLSSLILQPEDGPHVRPKHAVVRTLIILIIVVNIVVFVCTLHVTSYHCIKKRNGDDAHQHSFHIEHTSTLRNA